MLILAIDFYEILASNDITRVLACIIGNNGQKTRGGLIEKAHNIGRIDMAQEFLECSKTYFTKAEEGNIFSMRMLSDHYLKGKGCRKDKLEALYWSTKAERALSLSGS